MHIKKVFFSIFIFLICNLLRAQTFNFKNYTDEDGLAQSYVYCVSQSNKGFLYLSTGDGFCKFDGNDFKIFTTKDNLAENFINTHFTDSRNITWIGHFQNGISYLSGNNFYKIKGSEKLETKINAFAEDKSKNIWVAAQQKGLYKIDSALKFTQLKSTENENFNSVYFDLDNQLLAATDEGLFLFKTEGQKEMTPVCIVSGFEGKKIKCIIPCDSLRNSFWKLLLHLLANCRRLGLCFHEYFYDICRSFQKFMDWITWRRFAENFI
jgi:ligand-binding sensor domain-containing protein